MEDLKLIDEKGRAKLYVRPDGDYIVEYEHTYNFDGIREKTISTEIFHDNCHIPYTGVSYDSSAVMYKGDKLECARRFMESVA